MNNQNLSSKKTNLFIVGTIKAATTSIYNYLKQQPNIFFPDIKELHYFSNVISITDQKTEFNKHNIQHSRVIDKYDDYKSLYLNADTVSSKFLGDCSPTYLSDTQTPKKIFEYNPSAKIVVCIRNPIDRIISHYQMNVNRNTETRGFFKAINEDFKKPNKIMFIDDKNVELRFYGEQIKRFYKYFLKNQVYIIKFEDLNQNSEKTIKKLVNFLGLKSLEAQIFNKRYNTYSKPRLKIFLKLKKIYYKDQERLFKLIGFKYF